MCGSLKYAPSLGTGDCDWAFCVLRFGVVPYFHFRFKVPYRASCIGSF